MSDWKSRAKPVEGDWRSRAVPVEAPAADPAPAAAPPPEDSPWWKTPADVQARVGKHVEKASQPGTLDLAVHGATAGIYGDKETIAQARENAGDLAPYIEAAGGMLPAGRAGARMFPQAVVAGVSGYNASEAPDIPGKLYDAAESVALTTGLSGAAKLAGKFTGRVTDYLGKKFGQAQAAERAAAIQAATGEYGSQVQKLSRIEENISRMRNAPDVETRELAEKLAQHPQLADLRKSVLSNSGERIPEELARLESLKNAREALINSEGPVRSRGTLGKELLGQGFEMAKDWASKTKAGEVIGSVTPVVKRLSLDAILTTAEGIERLGPYARTLMHAATQGPQSLAVTDYLMQGNDPEYRRRRQGE